MTNIEKVLKQIESRKETIRIQGIAKKRKESLVDFIKKFFTEWNNEKETVYTKADVLNTNLGTQTDIGRRRSLGDVFLICRYYYPDVTLQEVAKTLYFTLFENCPVGLARMRASYCSTINRRVFYVGGQAQPREFYRSGSNEIDEFGFTYDQWKLMVEEPAIKKEKVVLAKKPIVKKKVAAKKPVKKKYAKW